jgi:hypothetical protein
VDIRTTGPGSRYPAGMTVPVHLTIRKRTIRQTGRDSPSVPTHTSTNGHLEATFPPRVRHGEGAIAPQFGQS